ncbi:MAG TPA: hypothetical protein VK191_08550 [Symbiobacteriaceae bacterium]|nr:hypothetical protein [Symbiobacteriaceae bacterium]
MAESRPVQKSLPHELVERFACEMAPPGLGAGGPDRGDTPGARPGRVGGRMVRVLIQYAEGALDP